MTIKPVLLEMVLAYTEKNDAMKSLCLILLLCLVGCKDSSNRPVGESVKGKVPRPQSDSKRIKHLLCKEWKLIESWCEKVDSDKVIELLRMNVPYDSFYCYSFKLDGTLLCNNKKIGKWSLSDGRINITGKNRDGFPVDVDGYYQIHLLDSKNLQITKYYFNQKNEPSLTLKYLFIDNSRLKGPDTLNEIESKL